jgi:predicted nucleotidyltransferase
MRLTPQERSAIAEAARDTLVPGSRVSLFGSRVDDSARGGDIDLLVDSPQALTAAEWVARRQAFVVRLYRLIGERRIDVLIAGAPGIEPPAEVLASARQRAVALVQT